jgi:hypothetical protein
MNTNNQEHLAKKVLSAGLQLIGSKAFFFWYKSKHPTYKTISEEHNRYFKIGIVKK